MGLKTSVYALGARRPKLAMAEHVPSPADARIAREYAERMFPGRVIDALPGVAMFEAYYPQHPHIGVFGDVVVVTGHEHPQWPSELDRGMSVELVTQSSADYVHVDYRDPDGHNRSIDVDSENTLQDLIDFSAGRLLPFEEGLWPEPSHPDAPEEDERPSWLEIANEALRWIFGVQGEVTDAHDCLPEEKTVLYGFVLAPAAGAGTAGPKRAWWRRVLG